LFQTFQVFAFPIYFFVSHGWFNKLNVMRRLLKK
jgi:hypothetical protein